MAFLNHKKGLLNNGGHKVSGNDFETGQHRSLLISIL